MRSGSERLRKPAVPLSLRLRLADLSVPVSLPVFTHCVTAQGKRTLGASSGTSRAEDRKGRPHTGVCQTVPSIGQSQGSPHAAPGSEGEEVLRSSPRVEAQRIHAGTLAGLM